MGLPRLLLYALLGACAEDTEANGYYWAEVTPERPAATDTLHCQVFTEQYLGHGMFVTTALESQFLWDVNGERVLEEEGIESLLTATYTLSGDIVKCTAASWDNADTGLQATVYDEIRVK